MGFSHSLGPNPDRRAPKTARIRTACNRIIVSMHWRGRLHACACFEQPRASLRSHCLSCARSRLCPSSDQGRPRRTCRISLQPVVRRHAGRRSISKACRGSARRRQLHLWAQRCVRSFNMAPITLPAWLGAPGLPCGRCRVRPCARAVMDPARSSGSMGSGTD